MYLLTSINMQEVWMDITNSTICSSITIIDGENPLDNSMMSRSDGKRLLKIDLQQPIMTMTKELNMMLTGLMIRSSLMLPLD